MRQAQQMQERMKNAERELHNIVVEADAGGGVVKAKVNGRQEVVQLDIAPELFNESDKDMLEELLVSAINLALAKAKEEAAKQIQSEGGNVLGNLLGNFKFPGT
jgi:DNA-binding YbaB/EbfC family protein